MADDKVEGSPVKVLEEKRENEGLNAQIHTLVFQNWIANALILNLCSMYV